MNPSLLSRKLLYYGYTEMTDYLQNSPLNRYLYKMLLDVMPKKGVNVPILTMFNEIYYQCVHINFDGTPGVDLEKRYIDDEAEWLKSKPASELLFCVVRTLLDLKTELSFPEECFLTQMTQYMKNSEFRGLSAQILKELRHMGFLVQNDFQTMPSPLIGLFRFIDQDKMEYRALFGALYRAGKDAQIEASLSGIEEFCLAWKVVTSDFNHHIINKLVCNYKSIDDQLAISQYIRTANKNRESDFFDELEEKIKFGHMEQEEIPDTKREPLELLEPGDKSHLRKYLYLERVASEFDFEEPVPAKEESSTTKQTNTPVFPIVEMVEYVKQNFSKTAANEFCTMCYRMLLHQGNKIDENIAQMLDNVDAAIIQRDAKRQIIEIPTAGQVNINPQTVVNQVKEEKDK